MDPSSSSGSGGGKSSGGKVSTVGSLREENASIRGLTLLFENKGHERRWNTENAERMRSISVRYLFAASVFQALFVWSDVLEQRRRIKMHNAASNDGSLSGGGGTSMGSSILGAVGGSGSSSQAGEDHFKSGVLFAKSSIRVAIASVQLLACFLVSLRVVSPTQWNMLLSNLFYGVTTLFLYYHSRATPSHLDSLYLVYGLAFFMLPKVRTD